MSEDFNESFKRAQAADAEKKAEQDKPAFCGGCKLAISECECTRRVGLGWLEGQSAGV